MKTKPTQVSFKTRFKTFRTFLFGKPLDLKDKRLYHNLRLIAVLAWVGFGADGLSSVCYGPQEAFIVLKDYPYLSIFVGLASAATVFILGISYIRVIELFSSGGGGYAVASKLLGPLAGMLAGATLLVDYVLTIAISIASAGDALCSFGFMNPHSAFKFLIVFVCLGALFVMNLRGTKESVTLLLPIFFIFLGTHVIAILVAIGQHLLIADQIVINTHHQVSSAIGQIGFLGISFLDLTAYAMRAGTYTGI